MFVIDVMPLILRLENFTEVYLQQGDTSVIIDYDSLGAQTNGEQSRVLYNITGRPQYGRITVNGKDVTVFTQEDVNAERVAYLQTDMSGVGDNFIFTVSNPEHAIRDLVMNISISPLVNQGVLHAALGTASAISLNELDATDLAELTSDNPQYMIQEHPRYGQIVRRQPEGQRNKRYVPSSSQENARGLKVEDSPEPQPLQAKKNITWFSHEDIKRGVIFYELSDAGDLAGNEDSFRYMLVASGVQPATGKFSIKIKPKTFLSTTKAPLLPDVTSVVKAVTTHATETLPENSIRPAVMSPPSTEQTTNWPTDFIEAGIGDIFRPRISEDDFLIIGLVCGVVMIAFLSFLVVAIFRCRSNHIREKEKAAQAAMWPQTNGHLDMHHEQELEDGSTLRVHDNYSYPLKTEVSQALPQCRVTPLVPRAYFSDTLSTERSSQRAQTVAKHYRGETREMLDSEDMTDESEDEDGEGNRMSWDPYDPALQHASKPALRNNQYWV